MSIQTILAAVIVVNPWVLGQGSTWQTNQPGRSSLAVNAATSLPTQPIDVTVCVNEIGSVTTDGQPGFPFEIALGVRPGVPLGQGGMVLPGNQILNVDLGDPLLGFVNGLRFEDPFPGPTTLPFVFSTGPFDVYAQQENCDPGLAAGFALSAFNGLHIVTGAVILGPDDDDEYLEVVMAGLCGAPPALTFAGASYARFFVNSNGSVTFSAGDLDPNPGLVAFLSGPPRLAALWTDLAPHLGGLITTSFAGGLVVVSFQDVVEFGTLHASRARLVFDPATGGCAIDGYAPHPLHTHDTLVGLSPGGGALNPGPAGGASGGMFSNLALGGAQQHPATAAIYELVLGGAPSGFSSILFQNGDATSWSVF